MRARSREIANVRLEIAEEQNRQRIGKVFPTLITGKSARGQHLGRTLSYRPVIIRKSQNRNEPKISIGDVIPVEIFDAGQVDLKGRIIEK
jgi:tRNA A37 methylthiotransferase MiaB